MARRRRAAFARNLQSRITWRSDGGKRRRRRAPHPPTQHRTDWHPPDIQRSIDEQLAEARRLG